MRAALDAIRAGRADGLVAVKMDRISRSVRDTLGLAETFERNGWLLATVDENGPIVAPLDAIDERVYGLGDCLRLLERVLHKLSLA